MSRSPLAYPLNRAIDADIGGAADLQTDVMRFMAILALCLVAIFALVQSIPMTPAATPVPAPPPPTAVPAPAEPPAAIEVTPLPDAVPANGTGVTLTRPAPLRTTGRADTADATPTLPAAADPEPAGTNASSEAPGFTLRFASDAALMRAVAAHHVGLYAIAGHRARRMTVSESRISFWDASTPAAFHEMEASTVPTAVYEALARTGESPGNVSWGVTLPGKLREQLDALMRQHTGGMLIISADGNIHREAS
ncbi:MAG TPA: hypothetical protein VIS31_10650 [Woeseiaceae bacterium]